MDEENNVESPPEEPRLELETEPTPAEVDAGESIQISAPVSDESGEVPELGDVIKIIGGRFNNVTGRIYYRDAELIRILPENFSDRLIDISIEEDGSIDADLGIENILIIDDKKDKILP